MTNTLIPALTVRLPVHFTGCTYLLVPRNVHNIPYSPTIYNQDEIISFPSYEIKFACFVAENFASPGISEVKKQAIPVCKKHKQPKWRLTLYKQKI